MTLDNADQILLDYESRAFVGRCEQHGVKFANYTDLAAARELGRQLLSSEMPLAKTAEDSSTARRFGTGQYAQLLAAYEKYAAAHDSRAIPGFGDGGKQAADADPLLSAFPEALVDGVYQFAAEAIRDPHVYGAVLTKYSHYLASLAKETGVDDWTKSAEWQEYLQTLKD